MVNNIDELAKKISELEKRVKDLESDVYNLDDYIPAHTLINKAVHFIEDLKNVGPDDFQEKFKINNYRAESLVKILVEYGYLSKEKDEKGRRTVIPNEPEGEPLTGENDSLLERAIKIVQEYDHASASLIQRRLAIGYARAARLLDQMEIQGIVGPAEGAMPREVLKKNPS
jgi:DNA segregation ATPase FtsK/SpoIIIE-like protein